MTTTEDREMVRDKAPKTDKIRANLDNFTKSQLKALVQLLCAHIEDQNEAIGRAARYIGTHVPQKADPEPN